MGALCLGVGLAAGPASHVDGERPEAPLPAAPPLLHKCQNRTGFFQKLTPSLVTTLGWQRELDLFSEAPFDSCFPAHECWVACALGKGGGEGAGSVEKLSSEPALALFSHSCLSPTARVMLGSLFPAVLS